MIVHLKAGVSDNDVKEIVNELSAFSFHKNGQHVLISSSGIKFIFLTLYDHLRFDRMSITS